MQDVPALFGHIICHAIRGYPVLHISLSDFCQTIDFVTKLTRLFIPLDQWPMMDP